MSVSIKYISINLASIACIGYGGVDSMNVAWRRISQWGIRETFFKTNLHLLWFQHLFVSSIEITYVFLTKVPKKTTSTAASDWWWNKDVKKHTHDSNSHFEILSYVYVTHRYFHIHTYNEQHTYTRSLLVHFAGEKDVQTCFRCHFTACHQAFSVFLYPSFIYIYREILLMIKF